MLICPHCGAKRFLAMQEVTLDVSLDENRNVIEKEIGYWEGEIHGPYYCAECGCEFDDLSECESKEDI